MPLYSLRWDSKEQVELEKNVHDAAAKDLKSVLKAQTISEFFSAENINSIGRFVGGSISNGAETFKSARENAKVAGKLLAYFLALGRQSPLFGDHTFTLIGFSLGGQLVKSAINRLKKLGCENILHNIYFMAGGTYIRREKVQAQKNAIISCING